MSTDSSAAPCRASSIIRALKLAPHPEGGFFRRTYASAAALTTPDGRARPACTAILYLLPGTDVSRLHRLRSDEIWHFHEGAPLTIVELDPSTATLRCTHLGPWDENGTTVQHIVPAGVWFGALHEEAEGADRYTLVSCTVAPGFDQADFEMAARAPLLMQFPQHAAVVERLTEEHP